MLQRVQRTIVVNRISDIFILISSGLNGMSVKIVGYLCILTQENIETLNRYEDCIMDIEEIRKGAPEGATHYIDKYCVEYFKLKNSKIYVFDEKWYSLIKDQYDFIKSEMMPLYKDVELDLIKKNKPYGAEYYCEISGMYLKKENRKVWCYVGDGVWDLSIYLCKSLKKYPYIKPL